MKKNEFTLEDLIRDLEDREYACSMRVAHYGATGFPIGYWPHLYAHDVEEGRYLWRYIQELKAKVESKHSRPQTSPS